MKKLPPLHVLQAFEAAARLQNFSRAAQELNLTHGAVSRHIQTMEHWCGERLFVRNGPKISLSDVGKDLHVRLAEPLQALHDALDVRQGSSAVEAVYLYTLPSIASTWVIPHLPSFHDTYPNYRLTVLTGYNMMSLPPHQVSAALRHGIFDREGLHTEKLMDESMVVVASPHWFDQHGRLPEQWPCGQMLGHTYTAWPKRVRHHISRKFHSLPEPSGTQFNDALMVLLAAVSGHGVAWARAELVKPWVARGELMLLEEYATEIDKAYWFTCRNEMLEHSAIRALRAWLFSSLMPAV